jgi:hypothetical protein
VLVRVHGAREVEGVSLIKREAKGVCLIIREAKCFISFKDQLWALVVPWAVPVCEPGAREAERKGDIGICFQKLELGLVG